MMKKFIMMVLITVTAAVIPSTLSARGALEGEREYQSLLEGTFNMIIIAVENDEMSGDEGKLNLEELRNRYNRHYNDEAGILDALIDQVEEKELTSDEAGYYFSLLRENRLMEHRLEQSSNSENPDAREQDNNDRSKGKENNEGESRNEGDEPPRGSS